MWLRLAPYIAAAVLAAGGVWYVMALRAENASLSVENHSLSREVTDQREAAEWARLSREVDAAHRRREATRAAEKERALEALLTGDFNNADTAIDPRIADFLSCMRREADRDPSDCAGGLGGSSNAGADQ